MPAPDIIVRENGGSAGDIVVSDPEATAYEADLAETVGLSEAVAAPQTLALALEEEVDLDEVLDEVFTRLPTALQEEVALAEAQTALLGAAGDLFDAVSLSENRTTLVTARPATAETVALTEQVRGGNRYEIDLAEDEVELDEAAADQVEYRLLLGESPTYGEGIDANTSNQQSVALFEGYSFAEASAVSWRARNALPETVATTEASALHGVYVDALEESVAFTEAQVARQLWDADLDEDDIDLAESAALGRDLVVSLIETVSVSDTLVSRRALRVSPVETVAFSEAQTGRQDVDQPLPETVTFSEARASRLVARSVRAEAMALQEVLVSRRGAHQALDDEDILLEESAPIRNTANGTAETVSWVEARAAQVDFYPPRFKEGFLIFEASASSAGMGSQLEDDPLELVEEAGVTYGARARLAVAPGWLEALDSGGVASRGMAETMALEEAWIVAHRARPTVAEIVTLAEALDTRGVFQHRRRRGWWVFDEVLQAQRGPVLLPLGEEATLAEAQLARRRVQHSFPQTVALSESLQTRVSSRSRFKEGYLIFEGAL